LQDILKWIGNPENPSNRYRHITWAKNKGDLQDLKGEGLSIKKQKNSPLRTNKSKKGKNEKLVA
jgi:hypothetical protein